MKINFSGLLGIIGLILTAFGVLAVFITQSFNFLGILQLVLGILACLIGFFGALLPALKKRDRVVAAGFRSGRKILIALLATLLFIFTNVEIFRLQQRVDLTEQGVYSLSPESYRLLSALQEAVDIYAIAPIKPTAKEKLRDLLKNFAAARPELVDFHLIDPIKSPHLTKSLNLSAGDKGVFKTKSGRLIPLKEVNENSLIVALKRSSSAAPKKLYYLTGHAEPEAKSNQPEGLSKFVELMERQNFEFSNLILADKGSVPADTALLIVYAPEDALPERDVEMIKNYVRAGGALLIFHEPLGGAGAERLLATFGLTLQPVIVLDTIQKIFDAPEIGWQIISRDYSAHEITRHLRDTDLTVFLLSGAFKIAENEVGQSKYTPLVRSSATAWGESNLKDLLGDQPEASFDPGADIKGPLTLGVAAAGSSQLGEGRLVAFADASWLTNANFEVYANDKLALNSVLWTLDQKNELVVAPKRFRKSILLIDQQVFQLIFVFSLLIPEIVLLIGIVVWWSRRRLVEN